MSLPNPNSSAPLDIQALQAPFPARTAQATGLVNDIRTDVMAVSFADKILVTISQHGRLAHWVHVPLDTADPSGAGPRIVASEDGSELLPMTHLTASTILGVSTPERDTMGQLYGTQIASALATRDPNERRLLVLGMGLAKAETSRESYMQALGKCAVSQPQ